MRVEDRSGRSEQRSPPGDLYQSRADCTWHRSDDDSPKVQLDPLAELKLTQLSSLSRVTV